jgi:hypothetical protein
MKRLALALLLVSCGTRPTDVGQFQNDQLQVQSIQMEHNLQIVAVCDKKNHVMLYVTPQNTTAVKDGC